jgi:hypothetical protein
MRGGFFCPSFFWCRMSYLYNGLCYSDPASVYRAMASSCPPVSSQGDPIICSVNSSGYSVQVGGGAVVNVVPSLIPCLPEISDASALGGLVVAALASVYAFKLLWRAI